MAVTIGDTVLSSDSCDELREAIEARIEGLKKTRKKCEDEKIPRGVQECEAKIETLRHIGRLLDPQGDWESEAAVGEKGDPKQIDLEEEIRKEREEYGDPLGTEAARAMQKGQDQQQGLGDDRAVKHLCESPVNSDDFRFAVSQASENACKRALETVTGETRIRAIEKRLAIVQGRLEGIYDLTDARKKALEVLSRAIGSAATISAKTVLNPSGSTVAKKVAEWMLSVGLATEINSEEIGLTDAGEALARELGYIETPNLSEWLAGGEPPAPTPVEAAAAEEEEADEPVDLEVVEPSEDEAPASYQDDPEGGAEEEGAVKVSAYYDSLEDDDDLLPF